VRRAIADFGLRIGRPSELSSIRNPKSAMFQAPEARDK
jgi:hypothetical protein